MEYLADILLGYLFQKQASVATVAMVLEDFLVVADTVAVVVVAVVTSKSQSFLRAIQCYKMNRANPPEFNCWYYINWVPFRSNGLNSQD